VSEFLRKDQPHFQLKLSESDIRLIYNAVDFYYKNREPPEKRPSYANEPNRHLEYVRQSMMTIMMDATMQKNG
tara:strand:- start:264 stop:482 length:219 start_codon:yes stop_codon:yes gene_type:complete